MHSGMGAVKEWSLQIAAPQQFVRLICCSEGTSWRVNKRPREREPQCSSGNLEASLYLVSTEDG
jgi:hypothetical protein